MHRSVFIAVGLCVLTCSAPAHAIGLGEAGELEHARANARAGGPLSERDAELLERYGCLSGTESASANDSRSIRGIACNAAGIRSTRTDRDRGAAV